MQDVCRSPYLKVSLITFLQWLLWALHLKIYYARCCSQIITPESVSDYMFTVTTLSTAHIYNMQDVCRSSHLKVSLIAGVTEASWSPEMQIKAPRDWRPEDAKARQVNAPPVHSRYRKFDLYRNVQQFFHIDNHAIQVSLHYRGPVGELTLFLPKNMCSWCCSLQ